MFIYFEQGESFVRQSVEGSLIGVIALSVFCFSYAGLVGVAGLLVSYLLALLSFFSLSMLLSLIDVSSYVLAFVAIILIFIQIRLLPTPEVLRPGGTSVEREMYLRMFFAAALVLLVTYGSSFIGGEYSGVLATFPVAGSTLAIFLTRYHSADHAVSALRAMLFGLIGMVVFFFCVSLLSEHGWPFLEAFSISIAFALLVQFLALQVRSFLMYR
ncbi:hypothetical protein DMO17_18545 [Aquipseudomonas alcaligenes]|uniref:Uncharacterized protein n=1 Tax=Aquipseudomonas alcaligenes TaxID=43263 RepID=A0A2V4LGL1_AQUAC|nr:hypothetical protein DMO17_18545 [Pseudomonas alcaligenes]